MCPLVPPSLPSDFLADREGISLKRDGRTAEARLEKPAIGLRSCVEIAATHTFEFRSQELRAPVFGEHPGPILPGRLVADMTRVAALEIGHPVILLVLVKTDNRPLHLSLVYGYREVSRKKDAASHRSCWPARKAGVEAGLIGTKEFFEYAVPGKPAGIVARGFAHGMVYIEIVHQPADAAKEPASLARRKRRRPERARKIERRHFFCETGQIGRERPRPGMEFFRCIWQWSPEFLPSTWCGYAATHQSGSGLMGRLRQRS
jgi:hypothetical protein